MCIIPISGTLSLNHTFHFHFCAFSHSFQPYIIPDLKIFHVPTVVKNACPLVYFARIIHSLTWLCIGNRIKKVADQIRIAILH